MDKVPMTGLGHQKLEDEIRNLKSVERPAVIRAIAEARAHGDLSENAEYHAAKERQGFIEGRILELEDIAARAQVIDPSKFSGKVVKFGATVTVVGENADLPNVRFNVTIDKLDRLIEAARADRFDMG